MIEFIKDYVNQLQGMLSNLPANEIEDVITTVLDARRRDAQIFVIGNGGSAATASHLAVDMGKCASQGTDRFRVMSLNDNVPWMLALANDLSYSDIFSEQLKNFARPGDVLLAFSGSGNSENVLRAVRYANSIGCETIGFSGYEGGQLKLEAQRCIVVDANHMGRIEDGHMVIQHLVNYYLMSLCTNESERVDDYSEFAGREELSVA